jgi:hypothetical protein
VTDAEDDEIVALKDELVYPLIVSVSDLVVPRDEEANF